MARNVLTMREAFVLAEMIKANYVASGLDNGRFADLVNMQEGPKFKAPITRHHVSNMIAALDIAPNRPHVKKSEGDCRGLTVRVQELEEQVKKLAATMAKLIK